MRQKTKLVIIGLDGASWGVINPMVAQGRLRNLKKLMDNGCHAELETITPAWSPVIWTTIATGKVAEKHGIEDFMTWRIPLLGKRLGHFKRPGYHMRMDKYARNLLQVCVKALVALRILEGTTINSTSRRAKAFWNIFGDAGYKVGVVDWMISWPAEEVNGFMVTDNIDLMMREIHAGKGGGELAERAAYPAELFSFVREKMESAMRISDAEIKRFINTGGKGMEIFRSVKSLNENKKPYDILKFGYVRDKLNCAVAEELLQREKPDVFAVNFYGIDGMQHFCWKYMHPELFSVVTREEISEFGEAILNYYEFADECLGRVMRAAGDDANFIIVSDHGVEAALGSKAEGEYSGGHMFGPPGISVFSGAGFAKAGEIGKISVRDIMPTMLALMGMPQARDMDGEAAEEALGKGFSSERGTAYVESYENAGAAEAARADVENPVEGKVKERLKGLGYL
ncbi:MAG: alkaline phosphatase family protein [Candidatus Diapherotrites archaeon]